MDIFANRLRERAHQLGISNAEAARRAGLDERRYGHYIAGNRQPDLATFKKIAEVLETTPNWLLGAGDVANFDDEKSELLERLHNAARILKNEELALLVFKAESIANGDSQ